MTAVRRHPAGGITRNLLVRSITEKSCAAVMSFRGRRVREDGSSTVAYPPCK